MNNIVTATELKRRGVAALEQALRHGPVHIIKRNKLAAVVLSEREYARLTGNGLKAPGLSAMQWLLSQSSTGRRNQADIDASLKTERDW